MIENKEVYIHIGYPKTATTTLQNYLFSNLEGFDVIGQPFTRENVDMQKLIHTITDCETLELDENNTKKNIEKFLTNNKKLIISEESLSTGSSLSGRVSRYEIANRLKILFPNAKIIVVLREQKSIIKSYYLQKKKIDENFKMSFDEWFEHNKKNQHKENIFQYFNYDKVVKLYEKLFGKENIQVLLFEEFKSEQKRFIKKLTDFLGISFNLKNIEIKHDNKTVTQEMIILRSLNKKYAFFKKLIPAKLKDYLKRKSQDGRKIHIDLTQIQEEYIDSIYSEPNQILQNLYALELNKYNYPLGNKNV